MSAKKLEQPQFEVGTKVVVKSDNHWQGVAVVTAVRELEPQYLVSIPNTPYKYLLLRGGVELY
jgi:hypothetical protein